MFPNYLLAGQVKGGHSKTFLLLPLLYESTPSWLKVMGGNEQRLYGGVGGLVPWVWGLGLDKN